MAPKVARIWPVAYSEVTTQDAEDADGELGEEQTAEAERGRVEPQPLGRVEVVPAAHLRGAR